MHPNLIARLCYTLVFFFTGLFFIIVSLDLFLKENHSTKSAERYGSVTLVASNNSARGHNDTVKLQKYVKKKSIKSFLEALPWYIDKGRKLPKPASVGSNGRRIAKLWPEEDGETDRIESQLMYIPPTLNKPRKTKKVLLWNDLFWNLKPGPQTFAECPVKSCSLSTDQSDAEDADAILFINYLNKPEVTRPTNQIWIFYCLESPLYFPIDPSFNNLVNWTATYRQDSEIVAPYEKWVYYDPKVTKMYGPLQNYASNKTHKVAWFVSNCYSHNNRLKYAQELQKYIQVDIYGACGNFSCPRSSSKECFKLLDQKYKFYLAFENSNCKDYITEKFFVNGLWHSILPIVMGPKKADYERVAPAHSYIHVKDFNSPMHLAEYLHKLDKDDDLYNSYFQWKGTGQFINTHFFCRLCAMLHDEVTSRTYWNITEWWEGRDDSVCFTDTWTETDIEDFV